MPVRNRKPTQEQLKRERLKELVSSASWPELVQWVKERVVEQYKTLEGCKGDKCAAAQGAIAAYRRILDLDKSLRSDEIIFREPEGEQEE